MKKLTLLFFILLPYIGYAQTEQPVKQHMFGVGLGYNLNSVMGDSIRPMELSLRYRLNNKHTFEVYTPIFFNKVHTKDGTNDVKKQTLLGVGIGYDYTFYTHSYLNFFAGISADYQWYQNRWDFHRMNVQENKDWVYYEWNKLNGINVKPNIGLRFSFTHLDFESKINLFISKTHHERYAYSEKTFLYSSMISEVFFPDEKFNKLQIGSDLLIKITYLF